MTRLQNPWPPRMQTGAWARRATFTRVVPGSGSWALSGTLVLTVAWVLSLPTGLFAQPPTAAEMARKIDQHLQQSWSSQDIEPASRSEDAEFCRRVWLDLAGVAPPVAQIRSFLNDASDDKRSQLVRRLLTAPRHASHMADRWNELLVPIDAMATGVNTQPLQQWLRKQFEKNLSYDHLVAEFLIAGGPADTGPALFYTSHALEPKRLAAATAQIFLGIQLQCAECHDHPFDRWKQTDFWSYAAFFSQLQQRQSRRGPWIEDVPGGEVTLPESQLVSVPMYPGVETPPEEDFNDHRRRQLTIWMASRDNPYLARAAVNRAWQHLFGRGLVEPVDAMDADHPASHPELLRELSEFFVDQRFDLRVLYEALASSDAYQLSSQYPADTRPAPDTFAVMAVKTLTPRQYYDSLLQNVFLKAPAWQQTDRSPQEQMREQFLLRMRASAASPVEYPQGVLQALATMNGPELQAATLGFQQGLLATLEAPFLSDEDRIETLYLATLSRRPREPEMQRCLEFLQQADSATESPAVRGDLLWALLCSTECAVCP